jgi:hypothetical protein
MDALTLFVAFSTDPYGGSYTTLLGVCPTRVGASRLVDGWTINLIHQGLGKYLTEEETSLYCDSFISWCDSREERHNFNDFLQDGGQLSNSQIKDFMYYSGLRDRFGYFTSCSWNEKNKAFINCSFLDSHTMQTIMACCQDGETLGEITCKCPNCGYNNPVKLATCRLCNNEIERMSDVSV